MLINHIYKRVRLQSSFAFESIISRYIVKFLYIFALYWRFSRLFTLKSIKKALSAFYSQKCQFIYLQTIYSSYHSIISFIAKGNTYNPLRGGLAVKNSLEYPMFPITIFYSGLYIVIFFTIRLITIISI